MTYFSVKTSEIIATFALQVKRYRTRTFNTNKKLINIKTGQMFLEVRLKLSRYTLSRILRNKFVGKFLSFRFPG